MADKNIKPWKKSGEPTVVGGKYGKKLLSQMFTHPETGKDEEFVLFGQKDWSVVLSVTKDNKVVAIRQYKQGCDQIVIELPAGTSDFKDEQPEQVIKRELLEETGYEGKKVILLGSPQFIATRSSWTRFHPFLAIDCQKVAEAKMDADENIETRLIPLEEWIKLALSELIEPSAVVATFRSLPYLKGRVDLKAVGF